MVLFFSLFFVQGGWAASPPHTLDFSFDKTSPAVQNNDDYAVRMTNIHVAGEASDDINYYEIACETYGPDGARVLGSFTNWRQVSYVENKLIVVSLQTNRAPGTFTVVVRAKNQGAPDDQYIETTKTFEVTAAAAPHTLDFSFDKASPAVQNNDDYEVRMTNIHVAGEASDDINYYYYEIAYETYGPDGARVLGSFTDWRQVTFVGDKFVVVYLHTAYAPGTYTVVARAKNYQAPDDQYIETTKTFEVLAADSPTAASLSVEGPVYQDTATTAQASVEGPGIYTYRFWHDSGSGYTLLSDWSSSLSVSIPASETAEVGTNRVKLEVQAQDSGTITVRTASYQVELGDNVPFEFDPPEKNDPAYAPEVGKGRVFIMLEAF
ncbi:hypothetical protein [Geoalkalibacter subterraneus]|uniref:Uncharacterized protein n=1 Tax=Geoalkalibacter subterraneus TaxID=483547 RepID=A0A0B5FWZ3_9BACT|nr:hypothetical protein [Geoalkalibacter subterraneus]AJF08121.1 hypothetical protein GSUB_16555 [Geoalkalibacter subterraneus]